MNLSRSHFAFHADAHDAKIWLQKMTRALSYVEFRQTVPVFHLEDDDGDDCAEICAICDLLGVVRVGQPLIDQYDFFHDGGDVLVFQADSDDQTFLSVNMFRNPTDQMNTVGLGVRCTASHAERVSILMRSIHERAEIESAFLQGNLGLQETLYVARFPRKMDVPGGAPVQHICVYRCGALN